MAVRILCDACGADITSRCDELINAHLRKANLTREMYLKALVIKISAGAQAYIDYMTKTFTPEQIEALTAVAWTAWDFTVGISGCSVCTEKVRRARMKTDYSRTFRRPWECFKSLWG